MMAIDGVAPLAKMAQQRTRRFMAAHLEAQRKSLEAMVRGAEQRISLAGGSGLVWQGAVACCGRSCPSGCQAIAPMRAPWQAQRR